MRTEPEVRELIVREFEDMAVGDFISVTGMSGATGVNVDRIILHYFSPMLRSTVKNFPDTMMIGYNGRGIPGFTRVGKD